ncbi:MAG: SRPBCC family protein [Candidatus Dormiibacterota bacterium]
MNEFEIRTVIDSPAERVFAFFENFDGYPDWSVGLTQTRKTSDGPLAVGSTATLVGKLLGRDFETSVEITEFEANHRFATKTTSGPFYLEVSYTLESVDGTTTLTTEVRGESKGFFKLAEAVTVRVTKKQFEAAAETLKALAEAQ